MAPLPKDQMTISQIQKLRLPDVAEFMMTLSRCVSVDCGKHWRVRRSGANVAWIVNESAADDVSFCGGVAMKRAAFDGGLGRDARSAGIFPVSSEAGVHCSESISRPERACSGIRRA